MKKQLTHGHSGSSAVTNVIQQTVDALVNGTKQAMYTFAIAPSGRLEAPDHIHLSFGLIDEGDGVLRWRITQDQYGPDGLHSETVYSFTDTFEPEDYRRQGVAAAAELCFHLHSLQEGWPGSRIYLVDVDQPSAHVMSQPACDDFPLKPCGVEYR